MNNINLILGNCIEKLKELEPNSIDLVISSPPYNVGIDYDNYNDNLSEKDYWENTHKWIKEVYRVVKIGGRICINIPIMGNNSLMKKRNEYLFHLPKYLNIIKEQFLLRECITWIKSYNEYDENVFCGGNTAWGSYLSPSSPYCRSFSEFIIVAHKENPKIQHTGKTDLTKETFLRYTKNIWFFPSEAKRIHPASFPEELPLRCIRLYSFIEDTVLDPFMGSGTTGVVCKKLNRKFIGIEQSSKYYSMAKQRIENTAKNLFEESFDVDN